MLEFFGRLFGTDFMPHAYCLRDPGLIALHAVSDGAIAFAYVLIPLALLLLLRRRADLVYPRLFGLCAIFVLGCGSTHILAVITLWTPVYRLDALLKVITAIASIATAIVLFRVLPQIVALPSAEALRTEIAERERVEHEMREVNRYLELRVVERTNELQRTNQRLVESELRVRHILDSASVLVYVKDLEGRYMFVNKAFADVANHRREEILGCRDEDLFGPDLAQSYRVNDRRALTEGRVEVEEQGNYRGSAVTYHTSKFPLVNYNGETYAVCGMSNDITDRQKATEAVRRASEELRESEERFRQIAELVPDMLWSANVDGRTRFISQRYLQYSGYRPDQFEGEGMISLFHPDDVPEIRRTLRHAIETGDPVEVEARIRRHDGVYRWFISRTVPVWNEDFQVEYLIGAVTDVDELKRAEQALRRSNEELEQFAYAAAHDLQEPLRNVSTSLGMLRRLVSERLTPDEADWIEKSIQNAVRMQAMVKDLLVYSRVVSDEEAAPPTVSADQALDNALANLDMAISQSRAKVTSAELPRIHVREQHLIALFQNLIGNSIKYRDPARDLQVAVSANCNGSECEFAVADNGIGFDPQYADRIFKVFKRLHSRDEYAGNGIGLAVCARIVAHYGGRIWAEGVPGQGATFRFTLPLDHK